MQAILEEAKASAAHIKAALGNMKATVFVTFQKHGLHRYPGAPDDVDYLKSTHRHLFKFRITVEVFHDDREIEFHQMQNFIMGLYEGPLVLDYKSCEMIARELMEQMFVKYGLDRDMEIEVNEDGENGATLIYEQAKRGLPAKGASA